MRSYLLFFKKLIGDLFSLRKSVFALMISWGLFNTALIIYRMYYSETIVYLFLIWNLFLAWIPYVLGLVIRLYGEKLRKISSYFILFVWLLFFPNALYILTDLYHLRVIDNMPLWYDLILILSFAFNGLFLGFVSLIYVQDFLQKKYSKVMGWIISLGAILLASFGIYLGRYLRWNSWDIISSPIGLFADIFGRIFNPTEHPRVYGMTIALFILLSLIYLMLKALRGDRKS
jgi:uncharacterized membrane protein